MSLFNKRIDIVLLLSTALLGLVSLWFHSTHPSAAELNDQRIGATIIGLSLLLSIWIAIECRCQPLPVWTTFVVNNAAWCVIIAAASMLFITQLTVLPPWFEEMGWLDLAKRISLGEVVHPIRAKSDFPSAFQAWPIAALVRLGVLPLLASRLLSAFLIVAYVYFLCRFLQTVMRTENLSWYVAAMALVSKSYVLVGMSGWHEVTPVFVLITAQWYFLIRIWLNPSALAKIALAIFAGLATWTIYTPTIMTVTVGLMLLPFVGRSFRRDNLRALLVYFLFLAPIVGQAIHSEGQMFSRHLKFYVHGGEWESSMVHSIAERVDKLFHTFYKVGGQFLPASTDVVLREYDAPHIELSLVILAVMGLMWIAVKLGRSGLYLLVAPACLFTLGFVLSTPNEYRETCLLVFAHVFAGLGAISVLESTWFRRYAILRRITLVFFLVSHYFLVLQTLPGMVNRFRTICPEGALARSLAEPIMTFPSYPNVILGSGGVVSRLLGGVLPYPTVVEQFNTGKDLSAQLEKYGNVPVLIVLGDGGPETNDGTMEVVQARGYKEIFSIKSGLNRELHAILLIPTRD